MLNKHFPFFKIFPINYLKLLVYIAVTITIIGVMLLFIMIISFTLPVVIKGNIDGIFSLYWQPQKGDFGIFPMIGGSFLLSLSALALGWPLSLGLTIWMLGSNKGLVGNTVYAVIRIMTAIPTVVYGFTAIFLLVPLVREYFGGTGYSWLSAGVILGLLITPTMTLVFESGLSFHLQKMLPEGLASGFTRLELFSFFVLPNAQKSFISAAVIGFGRAIGDTLISLMLAGNAPQIPTHLTDSLRTLTAHIALVSANEVGGGAYDSVLLAGFLLLFMNILVSGSLRYLGHNS